MGQRRHPRRATGTVSMYGMYSPGLKSILPYHREEVLDLGQECTFARPAHPLRVLR